MDASGDPTDDPEGWLDALVTERLAELEGTTGDVRAARLLLAEGLLKGAWRALGQSGMLGDDVVDVLLTQMRRLKAAGWHDTWPEPPRWPEPRSDRPSSSGSESDMQPD